MPSYKVVQECYVPIGGGTKFKLPGQEVILSVQEAEDLDGYVVPVGGRPPTVRIPDTGLTVRKPDTIAASKPRKDAGATIDEDEEVDSDGGLSAADNE